MAGSNKSLTLSYGAFSCTLEGFDDPINTLREITAHFSELTADAPHFGADPHRSGPDAPVPVPDAPASPPDAPDPAPGGAPTGAEASVPLRPDPAPGAAPNAAPDATGRPAPPRSSATEGTRDGAAAPPADPDADATPAAAPPIGADEAKRGDPSPEQPIPLRPEGVATTREDGAPPPAAPEASMNTARLLVPCDPPPPVRACAPGVAVLHPDRVNRPAGEADIPPPPLDAGGEDEAALARLLDETNAKLGEADGNRRRAAIAHLKAAVAATRADGDLRDTRRRDAADTLGRYRDDLMQATCGPCPDHDAETAPLVLRSGPRPPAATGFADFAEARGARALPDLIEAALAYGCEVEGEPGLPRPQIMRRAATLLPDGPAPREEGLRCFGELLRDGRIRKMGDGLFAPGDTAWGADEAQSRSSGPG